MPSKKGRGISRGQGRGAAEGLALHLLQKIIAFEKILLCDSSKTNHMEMVRYCLANATRNTKIWLWQQELTDNGEQSTHRKKANELLPVTSSQRLRGI